MSNAVSSSSTSSRASCRPDQLDQFAEVSLHALVSLKLASDRLETAWGAAHIRCVVPPLPPPPAEALSQLRSAAVASAQVVRETARSFRAADMALLVAGWQATATMDYVLAAASGERVPVLRKEWTLLRFQTADRGRLLEVRGDLATATHIVVMVPGMTNELANVDENFRPRSDRLYDELTERAAPGERVAVVMWLGYRNPNALPEAPLAATSDMARRGAATLNADLAALRATGTTAQITVVAHSYGTVVAGEALDQGMAVDRVVVVGSPGMNAGSRSALGGPGVTLYASSVGTTASPVVGAVRSVGHLASYGQPIGLMAVDIATGKDWAAATSEVGLHGADPAEPSFGAVTFPSDGSGHGAYFDARSLGLTNIALVSLGRQPVVRKTDAGPRRRYAVMNAIPNPARPKIR